MQFYFRGLGHNQVAQLLCCPKQFSGESMVLLVGQR